MLTNANPAAEPRIDAVPDAVPSDRNVREIVAICAKHDLPSGEPDNLAGLMRALHNDKYFAMDFWSVAARLTRTGAEASRPDWLLAIVVEGVTGRTVAEVRSADPANSKLVGKLARILAGEDDVSISESKLPPQPVRDSSVPSPREERPRLNLTLDPEPAASVASAADAQGPAQDPQDEPQIVIPLAAYADRERERRGVATLLVGALALALIAAGGFWLRVDRGQRLSVVARVGSIWKRTFVHQPSADAPQVSVPATSANPLAAPEQLPVLSQSSSPAAQTEPPQANPAQAEPAPNKSPQPEAARNKPVHVPARPAAANHHQAVDPVVLQAARESQQD